MEETNQTSQAQQPTNPTPAVNSTNSKLIPIILAIAAVVVIGIGAYLFGTKQTQTVVKNSVQTTPIPSPIPTIDETANWKTYTNEDKDISFLVKYPPTWKVEINCNGQDSIYTGPPAGSIRYVDSPCFTTIDFSQGQSGMSEGGLIKGGAIIITPSDFRIKTSVDKFCEPTGSYPKLSDCQYIQIENKEIVLRSGDQFAFYAIAGIVDSQQVTKGFGAYYNKESEKETRRILPQMLSTFRLTTP